MNAHDQPDWPALKQKLQRQERKKVYFNEGEIWWCHIGENIGDEENGKGEAWSRPVLIIRKFNDRHFLGIPLTTQIKENPYYYSFEFKKKHQCAMFSQCRTWDSKRLQNKMGKLSDSALTKARTALQICLFIQPPCGGLGG